MPRASSGTLIVGFVLTSGVGAMLREHPSKRPLDQVVALYFTDCRARNLSPKTLEQYEGTIRSYRAFLGTPFQSHVLADLNAEAARAWVVTLKATRKPTSIRSAVRALKVLGSWIAREGLTGGDPLATLHLPKAPRPVILPLSGSQVAALMDEGGPLLRACVAVLADTGIRAAELCGLRVEDVRDGFLLIHGKGGKERLVPYGAGTAAEVIRYVNRARPAPVRRGEEFLFLLDGGGPLTPNRVGKLMRQAGKRAGIAGVRCSPHTLRHTFATEFLRNGGGELALQKALGHRSLDMVKVYAELTELDLLGDWIQKVGSGNLEIKVVAKDFMELRHSSKGRQLLGEPEPAKRPLKLERAAPLQPRFDIRDPLPFAGYRE